MHACCYLSIAVTLPAEIISVIEIISIKVTIATAPSMHTTAFAISLMHVVMRFSDIVGYCTGNFIH